MPPQQPRYMQVGSDMPYFQPNMLTTVRLPPGVGLDRRGPDGGCVRREAGWRLSADPPGGTVLQNMARRISVVAPRIRRQGNDAVVRHAVCR